MFNALIATWPITAIFHIANYVIDCYGNYVKCMALWGEPSVMIRSSSSI